MPGNHFRKMLTPQKSEHRGNLLPNMEKNEVSTSITFF
jgi:hypothetical protein